MSVEDRILELISKKKQFINGQELAEELGLSRATINRIIYSLKEKGYPIEAHPKKGYRLLPDDLSYADNILTNLNTPIPHRAYYLPSCSTTQEIAESLAVTGAMEGIVVLAEEMTRGRGRLGREWFAAKGGLWMSVLYRPVTLVNMQLLTLSSGLSVAKSIEYVYGIKAKLKWPNDVLVNNKKIAGILVEAKIEADSSNYVIVGIGVNVNNDVPKAIENAGTIKEILGKKVYRLPLLKNILSHLDNYYVLLKKGKTSVIINEWKKYSSTIHKHVKVITSDGKEIIGEAIDIGDDGSLIIIDANNRRYKVYAGDVVHLR